MSDEKKAAPSGMPNGLGVLGFEKLKAHRPAGDRSHKAKETDQEMVDRIVAENTPKATRKTLLRRASVTPDPCASLECDHCGSDAITSETGVFRDGDGHHCETCGFAWELTHGPIPTDRGELCVCHHCDNPPCCKRALLTKGSAR